MVPGRTDHAADYPFYNSFTARFITEREAEVVLRGMYRRLQSGHAVGEDFSEVDDAFVGSDADLL